MAGKKRLRNRNLSKQAVNKLKRAKGEEYESRNGEIKSAKIFNNCNCGCESNCLAKVSYEEREALFKEYHKIGDVTSQKKFYRRHDKFAKNRSKTGKKC